MVAKLRAADIRAELYLGSGKFGAQMKYADKRNAPCVVIQGSDEKAKGEVTIKDLVVGADLAKLEKGREEHLQKQAEAQFPVAEDELVEAVRKVLARHGTFLTNTSVPTSWRSTLRLHINGARQSSSNGDAYRAKGP